MYYKIKNEICSAFLKWIIKVQKVNFWRGSLCKYFFFRIILCKCFLVSLTKIYIAFLDKMSRPNSQLARYCLLWSHMLHSFILLDVTQPRRKMSLSLFRVQGIRALALENSNATLFYNSKSHFIIIPYHFTIPSHLKLLFSSFTH